MSNTLIYTKILLLWSHIIVQYFTKRYLKKFCAAALPFIPGVPLTALCGDFLGFRNNFLFEYPTLHMNNYKLNTTHEYPTFQYPTQHIKIDIYNCIYKHTQFCIQPHFVRVV